jgi:predicted alpha/beta-fold hydrolase
MLQKSQFEPAWWLRNAHAQTVWATLMRPEIPLALQPQRLELSDGDFIDVIWDSANAQDQDKPIVVILHGLAGSVKSPYARGLISAFSNAGWRPVFMHFRGSSGEPNRLARYYHSGDTKDVAHVVTVLQEKNPNVDIAAVGVSLGGNVILKWLGETGANNPLVSAVAVSVPFELNQATKTMNSGLSKIYQWRLLRQLRIEVEQKFKSKNLPCPFDLERLSSVKNFHEFDDLVTAPLHNFIDANDYYSKSSSRQYLPDITVPTLIIHAEDDPFMRKSVIPTPTELSPSTILELSQQGGHVGFVAGNKLGKADYWLETRIPEYLARLL